MTKSVPDTICMMPFVSLGTKPDGVARVCCMAPHLEAVKDNERVGWPGTTLEETWNGETFREVRKRMLSGEKLPECSACWKEEAAGKKSKRITENQKFSHHIDRINNCHPDGRVDQLPVYFDLRLGNTCNLKCRTCNPMFSSAIASELRHHKSEWQNDKIFAPQYTSSLERGSNSQSWTDDPDFWLMVDRLAETAEEMYISGGEPTLVPKLIEFLERCVKRGHVNSRIRLNSNMTRLPPAMIDSLSYFKRVDWGASVDGIGLRNDWMRFPSKFEEIEENVRKLIARGSPFNVEINCTVSVFNVANLPEMHAWARDLGVRLTVDVLHEPSYMQLENLPDPIKSQTIARLLELVNSKETSVNEKRSFSYVIKRLNEPRNIEAWQSVVRHAKMIDRWQGKDITVACPELAEFL